MRFNIHVSPVVRVSGCAEKRAQEERGLFGFHMFDSCPNCVKVAEGWEGWGENGHLQFSAGDRAQLTHVMKYQVMRHRYGKYPVHFIRSTSTIYYRG
jgi:hypothetical protein